MACRKVVNEKKKAVILKANPGYVSAIKVSTVCCDWFLLRVFSPQVHISQRSMNSAKQGKHL